MPPSRSAACSVQHADGPTIRRPRSRLRRMMSLMASLDMLAMPGMSVPACLAAFRRRLLNRPISPRVCSARGPGGCGVGDRAVPLGQVESSLALPPPPGRPTAALLGTGRTLALAAGGADTKSPHGLSRCRRSCRGWPCPLRRPATGAEAGALVHERGVGHGPAVVAAADGGGVGHPGVGEEDLVEHGVAGHLAQRADLDARLVHVDGEPGDALVLGHLGVGAGDEHAQIGHVAERRPHLLAVDDPLVAVLRPGR
jgi:hypothetical protein